MAVEGLSGIDALANLSGTTSEVEPIRVLFLVHRVCASGRLWLTRGVDILSIDFIDGQITGCGGFTSLLENTEGERSWSVAEWSNVLIEAGAEPHDAASQVGEAICAACIHAKAAGGWLLNFVPEVSPGEQAPLMGDSLGVSIQKALHSCTPIDDVRSWFESGAAEGMRACRPVDSPVERWCLDAKALRLLEAVETDSSVGSLFVEIGADGWSSLGVLWKLGLVEVAEKARDTDAAQSEESVDSVGATAATAESELGAEEAEPVSQEQSRPVAGHAKSAAGKPTKGQEKRPKAGRSSEGRPKKKRRLDPRLVAIRRNPWESPPDQIENHLKEAYDVFTSVRPEFIFRLKRTSDLEKNNIDKRHREVCARYHPDRYRKLNQGSKALAEGCFTAVSDAYHKLVEAEYLEALRIRLIEKETGKKVVTDKTRIRAKVDYAKSEALFKQKRFQEAYELAGKAVQGDPERWQHDYMRLRSGYRCSTLSVEEVEVGILRLQGMTTVEKADQLYTLGEILLREGQDKKAYKLFRQAVSLDEQNVGANRRLRLRDRRERAAEKDKPQGGLFGGLFQRRKG